MLTLSYWQLMKRKTALTTLLELGTIAEHYCTEMAHAMVRAIVEAKLNGSEYGWLDE